MSLRLCTDITIGNLSFDFVNAFDNKSTWKNLTDTATIKLPRALKTLDGVKLGEAVKIGDKVSAKFGYDLETDERFTGYVARVGADTAIAEIECEDEMWLLKRSEPINKSWKDTDVRTVIDYIKQQTGAKFDVEMLGDSIGIGQFKIEGLSGARALQKLKDDCFQTCFFRDGKLIVGKPYEPDPRKRTKVRFEYGKNIISWRDLKYQRKDEVRLKVRAISNMPDGKKKEVTVGDSDGEERTLNFYNISETALKQQAEAMIDKLKFDGYRGTFPAFGYPLVKHGYVVELRDWRYPERNGDFFVDTVDIEVRVATFRQIIELGFKAN